MYETLRFYNQTATLTNILKVFDLNKALDKEYKQSFQQISKHFLIVLESKKLFLK